MNFSPQLLLFELFIRLDLPSCGSQVNHFYDYLVLPGLIILYAARTNQPLGSSPPSQSRTDAQGPTGVLLRFVFTTFYSSEMALLLLLQLGRLFLVSCQSSFQGVSQTDHFYSQMYITRITVLKKKASHQR